MKQTRDELALQFMSILVRKMDSAARRRYFDGLADGREAVVAFALADAFIAVRDADPSDDDRAYRGVVVTGS